MIQSGLKSFLVIIGFKLQARDQRGNRANAPPEIFKKMLSYWVQQQVTAISQKKLLQQQVTIILPPWKYQLVVAMIASTWKNFKWLWLVLVSRGLWLDKADKIISLVFLINTWNKILWIKLIQHDSQFQKLFVLHNFWNSYNLYVSNYAPRRKLLCRFIIYVTLTNA